MGFLKYLIPINKTCPKCGYQSAYNDYCYKDGTRLVRHKRVFPVCPNCKKEVYRTDKYCGECGECLEPESV